MKPKLHLFRLSFLVVTLSILFTPLYSQEGNESNDEETIIYNKKGFQIGLYVGAYFANKYTAQLYDGYGFDIDGNRNSYENSFMYNKIVLEYGGGYGQTDYIANELNVAPGDWSFNESDMPVNMRYNPAFATALQIRYSVDERNAILINVNGTKINVYGNFTITTNTASQPNQTLGNIHTFAIRGAEQRLIFQMGYQRLLGESNKINFLVEGGLNVTISKFDKSEILIKNLLIDLTQSFQLPGYPNYIIRKPIGTGYGAFAGFGVNFSLSEQFRAQLVYNPSYERINIGENRKLKLQNSVGLRMYYNF